ncbi:MAG: hypothetical protein DSY92_09620 [Planctomycetota bacterium]|nr:MAG: hypothetical protein DSY92_09620 [Planctomycetota bacterium]
MKTGYRKIKRMTAAMRINHWIVAISMVAAVITGLYIGHPYYQTLIAEPAVDKYVMAWNRWVHLMAAIIFDVSSIADIEKGILTSDLGITPQTDGKLLRLKVPPLSEERRKQLVSRAKEVAEESRVSMRNIRRDANKHIDTSKKDGDLSEDDQARFKGQVQEVLKSVEKQVDEDLKRKTEELMEI